MSGDEERWAEVPGHRGYEASTHGRIRNARHAHRVLKPTQLPSGYWCISLGAHYRDYVHRIVLFAFVGKCPKGKQCAHDDGNRSNNRLDNLEWKTPRANGLDRRRHGTALFGERNPAWAGESCKNGHAFTAENTRVERRETGTVRVCRTCAREHTRQTRNTPTERYRDGWNERLEAGLELMRGGMRALQAAQAVGVGRAALGSAWKASGSKAYARPRVMTDDRVKLTKEMLDSGKSIMHEILPALQKTPGLPVSRGALYSWTKDHKRLAPRQVTDDR